MCFDGRPAKEDLLKDLFAADANVLSKKILIVEDNEINIKVTELMLIDMNITNITVAKSGESAIKLFSPHYDLVLLDIGLPDADGIELCIEMRSILSTELPIIAYTANGESIRQQCLNAGFSDFLVKPTSFNHFRNVISHWLTNNQ